MRISTALKHIEKRKEAVAKERDKLRDLIDELEELKETCDRAYDCLNEAADNLSELV